MKATVHAFALTTYLPIPKFLDISVQVQATLAVRIYYICLNIICKNLKAAKKDDALLSDPTGNLCQCYTVLASWIADLPKQCLLVGILSNQSPFSQATQEQFGDLHTLPLRHCDHTIGLICQACALAHPTDLSVFL